jgi:hypothetical protein
MGGGHAAYGSIREALTYAAEPQASMITVRSADLKFPRCYFCEVKTMCDSGRAFSTGSSPYSLYIYSSVNTASRYSIGGVIVKALLAAQLYLDLTPFQSGLST